MDKMDRNDILQGLGADEIKLLFKLKKPATKAMDAAVEKWLEAQEILNNLYKEQNDPTEKKVLDLLIAYGLSQRDEDLRKSKLCIMRTDLILHPISDSPSEVSVDEGETTEETAEEQGESSLDMWKRQQKELFDEEQLNSCEWMPADTLEVAEMICLCENYFRKEFSRHRHGGGNLESLRLPMKDYIAYIKENSLHQDNYPDKWVRSLMKQLVFEGWIFGRDSKIDGWSMKPFSRGCIGFPPKLDEHPAVMQSGSIDLMQYCNKTEQ